MMNASIHHHGQPSKPSWKQFFSMGSWSILLALCLAFTGCSPPKSYYLLTPTGLPPTRGGTGIGVGPIAMAAYLERSNLVFQETGNRLALAESHRWAGNLEDNIASVVATNLGRIKGSGNVRTYPWTDDSQLRYQISIDVRQMHGTANGDAFIDATWRVYSLPDRRLITSKSWSGTEPLVADGYDELAAAQSRLLARLSDRIASSL